MSPETVEPDIGLQDYIDWGFGPLKNDLGREVVSDIEILN
jgi:hypothetical protein